MSTILEHIYCSKCKSKRVFKNSDVFIKEYSMEEYRKYDAGLAHLVKPVFRNINVTLRCLDCGHTVGYIKRVVVNSR